MPNHISRASKALALCGATALALSACQADTTVTINEGGTIAFVVDFSDDTGALSSIFTDCQSILDEFSGAVGVPADDMNAAVEDLSSGDNFHCLLSVASSSAVIDGEMLSDDGDTYTLTFEDPSMDISSQELHMYDAFSDFTLNVEMPGAIVHAPGASLIEGNVATYDSLSTVVSGVTVTGYKTGDGTAAATSPSPEATESTEPLVDDGAAANEDSSAFSTPVIIGLIALLLAVVGGLIFLMTRKKNDGGHEYGQYGYVPGSGDPNPHGNAQSSLQPNPYAGQQSGQQNPYAIQQPGQQPPIQSHQGHQAAPDSQP